MEEREREKGGRKKLISTLEKATLSPPYSFSSYPTPLLSRFCGRWRERLGGGN